MPKFTDKQCEVFQQRVDEILEPRRARGHTCALAHDGELFLDGWFTVDEVKAILDAIPKEPRVVWRVETTFGAHYTENAEAVGTARNNGATVTKFVEDIK